MPNRAAWSRLIVTLICGAFAKRSLETSASSPSVCSLSSSFCDHAINSGMSGSCSVYWKLARADRPPTVISWVAWRNRFAPLTLAICGRNRSIICVAESVRCSRGFNAMKKRAVFAVCALPLPPVLPVCDANPAISGSRSKTVPKSRCRRIISSGETSCAASASPPIIPVSWIGKKPLGISMARTMVSAKVVKNTASVIA